MQKTDLPYYVTNFFAIYLPGQKNLSKNTIASYAVTFKLFFIFCKDKKKKTETFYVKRIVGHGISGLAGIRQELLRNDKEPASCITALVFPICSGERPGMHGCFH